MREMKFARKRTPLVIIVLCIVVSVVFIGVLEQNLNESLQSQVNARNIEIQSLNSTIDSLNSTVRTLNSTVSTLNETVDSLNTQTANLQKQLNSETISNSALQTELGTKSALLTSANDEISSLENEISTNADVIALKSELSAANTQIAGLQKQIASDNSTIASLNSQIANLESTILNWANPVKNGFSIIQMTDTQYLSDSYPNLFNTLTSWIVNNSDALNVSMVVHTGDIVEVANSTADWQNANSGMMQLFNNGIPYCWDAGNHDQLNDSAQHGGGNPDGSWLGENYQAFNVTIMRQEPYWVADIFDGANTAVQFSYGNYRFMVINIEYDANQTVLNWMETLLQCNPNVNVIVATHNFLNGKGGYGYAPVPESVTWATNFEKILDNYTNVFMTLNGHELSPEAYNLKVMNREEIFFNRQELDSRQGAACARIYTFNMSNAGKPTVNVYTYQTYQNGTGGTGPAYLTDPLNQFNFTCDLIPYSPTTVSISNGTNFLGASGFDINFSSAITLSPAMQNIGGQYLPTSQAAYNQTGDSLSFYNLTMNGYTSNLTVSTVGADIAISSFNVSTISYSVDAPGSTQTFQLNNAPASVSIDGNPVPLNYSNGVLTISGAKNSVNITLN